MIRRIITGSVLLAIGFSAIFEGHYLLFLVVAFGALVSLSEILTMFGDIKLPNRLAAYGVTGLLLLSSIWPGDTFWLHQPYAAVFVFISMGIMLIELSRRKVYVPANPTLKALRVAFIIGVYFVFFYLIRQTEQGLANAIFCLSLTWVSDIFAYFGGRAFGKHKLAPHISPNKTIEGSISAILCTLLMSGFYIYIFHLNPMLYFPLAFVISVLGQLGDLYESLTKRFFKIKDSSALLPGHGGIYDRVDSMLFVVPIAYYILVWSA